MWEYLILLLITIALFFYLKSLTKTANSDYWKKLGYPQISNTISLFDLLRGQSSHMDGDVKHYEALGDLKYGGVVEFGTPTLLLKDLDLARNIFMKDFDHFFDRRGFASSDPLFANVLFNMKGQVWKDMRAFLSPTFTSGRIKRMFPKFGQSAKNLNNYLKAHSKSGKDTEIRVNEVMRRFTVDIICSTAFGMESDVFTNPNCLFFKMAEGLADVSLTRKITSSIFASFPKLAAFLKLSSVDGEVSSYFSGLLRSVLHSRESHPDQVGDDFLQLIVEARRGELVTDESQLTKEEKEAQLQNKNGNKNNIVSNENIAISQCFAFLLAGFDSIANNLAVAAHQLARYPDMQDKIVHEVDEICGTREEVTYEDINAMDYLDNFISETLRLYPAASRIERVCMSDYPIPGEKLVIPKGTVVSFSVEAVHRDDKYWPNPTAFDPSRFNAENKAGRNSYAYAPFGIGPRNCIAMRFALVETKAALANLVRNFKIAPTDFMEEPVREVFGYRMPTGSKMRFIPRN